MKLTKTELELCIGLIRKIQLLLHLSKAIVPQHWRDVFSTSEDDAILILRLLEEELKNDSPND